DRALPREARVRRKSGSFFVPFLPLFFVFSIVLTWTFSWKMQGGLDQFPLYLGEKRLSFVKEHKNSLKSVGPSWL
ncbi:hypothetical protein OCH80_08025, partial [Lactobacillus sp. 23-2]|uniref:hypothetical protein n=1 Tax=Lactobacillus sp. 23-2 TaxID=2981842 RepID=UPI00383897BB